MVVVRSVPSTGLAHLVDPQRDPFAATDVVRAMPSMPERYGVEDRRNAAEGLMGADERRSG